MPIETFIPARYLRRIASEMEPADRAFFKPGCLALDHDRRGWINPYASPEPDGMGEAGVGLYIERGVEGLILTRLADGFRADLRLMPMQGKLERHAKPDPIHGKPWIQVVEFEVPDGPTGHP